MVRIFLRALAAVVALLIFIVVTVMLPMVGLLALFGDDWGLAVWVVYICLFSALVITLTQRFDL